MLDEDPIESDEIRSLLPTMVMPVLACSNRDLGVLIHIDDCFCDDCANDRGKIKFGATILLEITNNHRTMVTRLLPKEAESLARELLRHSQEQRVLHQKGVWENEQ